jgi:glutamyl-tRNA synthetase
MAEPAADSQTRPAGFDSLGGLGLVTGMTVRTRFAPSPTGYLHIGGARTALFIWLFARHHAGTFVLRIEDTDRERSTPESIQAILDGLGWLGIDWDEGPFYQTRRFPLYRGLAERLLATGRAYRCWCTAGELEERRQRQLAAGGRPAYDRTCRDRTTPPAGRDAHVLRFKTPLDGRTVIDDLVKGPIVFENAHLDDFVIQRSDGSPIYNFCVVADDVDMRITHVIRGDDHVANTPRQILLYQALDAPLPRFAHVPLILGQDKTRLSKRHGATSVMAYHEQGFLPEAMVNFLARLGWSHGDQELFTRDELVQAFSLEHVGSSPAVFNAEKLVWTNFQWMKGLESTRLAELVVPYLERAALPVPADRRWLARAVDTLRDRAKTLVELAEFLRFYVAETVELQPKAAAQHLKPEIAPALRDLVDRLEELPAWDEASIESAFQATIAAHGLALGKLAQPVRVAVTGGTVSPGIYTVLDVLGRERALARLHSAQAGL